MFTEDIVKFAQEAIAMIGEWGEAFVGAIKDFASGVSGSSNEAGGVFPQTHESIHGTLGGVGMVRGTPL